MNLFLFKHEMTKWLPLPQLPLSSFHSRIHAHILVYSTKCAYIYHITEISKKTEIPLTSKSLMLDLTASHLHHKYLVNKRMFLALEARS